MGVGPSHDLISDNNNNNKDIGIKYSRNYEDYEKIEGFCDKETYNESCNIHLLARINTNKNSFKYSSLLYSECEKFILGVLDILKKDINYSFLISTITKEDLDIFYKYGYLELEYEKNYIYIEMILKKNETLKGYEIKINNGTMGVYFFSNNNVNTRYNHVLDIIETLNVTLPDLSEHVKTSIEQNLYYNDVDVISIKIEKDKIQDLIINIKLIS